MAISVTIRGTVYSIPTVGEVGWGAATTALLQVLASAAGVATTTNLGAVKLARAAANAASPTVIPTTGGGINSTANDIGLDVAGSGSGAGIRATGGVTATYAIEATAAAANHAIHGDATVGRGISGTATSGIGVRGEASSSGGNGVVGIATDAVGVLGTATSGEGIFGGATTGIGVQGASSGADGIAGHFAAAAGYGVYCQGDTTNPAKAALHVEPQNAQPTGPNAVGDMYVTSAGVLKICTSAGSPGTWVSVGAQ